MIRGTTPNVRFKIKNLDTDLIETAEIYFGQRDRLVIKKDNEDCIVERGFVSCFLSQEDTLCLNAKERVDIQLRVIIKGDVVLSTKIFKRYVYEIVDEEVIKNDP